MWIALVIVAAVPVLPAALSIRVFRQYERACSSGSAGCWRARAGRAWCSSSRVSLRIVTMPIPAQEIITRDNVSVDISAVAYFRVKDPIRSVVANEDVESAIGHIAQWTLRAVVGRHTLDETLSDTDSINRNIREILDATTEEWGILVTLVELKDIQLPEGMKRPMAKQAEAEREKRAKITGASDVMMRHPIALQLRNLRTLVEISVDKNSTVIFPAPPMSTIEEMAALLGRERRATATLGTNGDGAGEPTPAGWRHAPGRRTGDTVWRGPR